MGTYLDIQGDPNEVSATGALLRSMAENLRTKVQAVQADIEAVEAERPWGNDEFGQGFEATYNGVPPGGDKPLRESIEEGMSHAGERLTRVGEGTILAMTGYQGVDHENAADIKKAGDV